MKNYLVKICLIFCGLMTCLLLANCKKDDVPIPENKANSVIDGINLLRQSGCNCGTESMPPVPLLKLNTFLQDAAQTHARDMAQKNYFDHFSPEGTSPNERAAAAGYPGIFISENLAKGYNNADQVLTAWKNSVSHCKAMMDAKNREAGMGTAQNYWVVTFGAP
ncbi:CAP domain-containing protein [Pedobacter sp. Leaf216]|uniref:CAP domain-containing protein n=1 Tax=Pedobacter sp. Leaf216 TaxID=1735684 RepID=UPI0009EC315B|nr:CAP domain-containing protein [Pedobacter sp. Leaf216]